MKLEDVIQALHLLADKSKVSFKKEKYNISSGEDHVLGLYQKDIKEIAKEIGKNKALAIDLFHTNIYEAKLLCSKIFPAKELTEKLMDQWVVHFDNWEICDSFCMEVFAKSQIPLIKIEPWSTSDHEFIKRASFATMAAYCMADKKASNDVFISFFPFIEKACNDNRIYVRKAVSWALRNIGKRNIDLHERAVELAQKIQKEQQTKAAQWISKDVLRELTKPDVRMSDYPRTIYRA